MITYTTVGTNDLPRAAAFYDALFALLGYRRVIESVDKIAWGIDLAHPPLFFVTRPFDGQPATVGNGTMIGLGLKNPAEIRAAHARVLELGGSDEGPPGPRGPFYCGYFRDLDGNKLNLHCVL